MYEPPGSVSPLDWTRALPVYNKDSLFPEKHKRSEDRQGGLVEQSSFYDASLHQTYYVLRQIIRYVYLRIVKKVKIFITVQFYSAAVYQII